MGEVEVWLKDMRRRKTGFFFVFTENTPSKLLLLPLYVVFFVWFFFVVKQHLPPASTHHYYHRGIQSVSLGAHSTRSVKTHMAIHRFTHHKRVFICKQNHTASFLHPHRQTAVLFLQLMHTEGLVCVSASYAATYHLRQFFLFFNLWDLTISFSVNPYPSLTSP